MSTTHIVEKNLRYVPFSCRCNHICSVHQYVSDIFKKAYFYSCSMKNEDNFGDDCWLHAKEAARLVEERRKEVTHKYHKKAAKLQEEVEEDCEEKECKEVVVVLLGLPASGKSTLCRQLKERAVERGETVLTVDYDALIPLARQAKMVEEEGAWKKERETIGQAVSSLLHQMHSNDVSDTSSSMPYLSQLKESCLTLGKETKVTVLVDDNNYLSSMRKPWHRLARERSAGFCQIFVQTSSEQAKARNSMREAEERVPASVIDSMADRLEPPRPLVQAWEELSFTVSAMVMYIVQPPKRSKPHGLTDTGCRTS